MPLIHVPLAADITQPQAHQPTMQSSVLFLAVLAILGGAFGFQVAPRAPVKASSPSHSTFVARASSLADIAPPRTTAVQRRQRVSMQFGGKNDGVGPIERGSMPSYEEEQEKEFFKSELDTATTKDKVKDPLVFVTLGWILGMFVLATAFIVNGVN